MVDFFDLPDFVDDVFDFIALHADLERRGCRLVRTAVSLPTSDKPAPLSRPDRLATVQWVTYLAIWCHILAGRNRFLDVTIVTTAIVVLMRLAIAAVEHESTETGNVRAHEGWEPDWIQGFFTCVLRCQREVGFGRADISGRYRR
ncbi:hypothetical protein KIV56_17080 [Cryobacterium breve]|uniref:Uncharacterized protein n=1 Tax=Cryobacterium breve TaxID=1259258 RepID=A0ABY7NBI3_9MICO|nr:hypothetical protein [Cryobacterium breve]WBM79860.1 hypothetical protein KIV56_17080 [Cryobacterium breve]